MPSLAEVQRDPTILTGLPWPVIVDFRRQISHLAADVDAVLYQTLTEVRRKDQRADVEPDRLPTPEAAAARFGVTKRWLLDHAEASAGGKTTLMAALGLWWADTQEAPNEILVVANDLEQAASRAFATMVTLLAKNPELGKRAKRASNTTIKFTTGITIRANEVRLLLGVIAYNLGNLLRRLVLPISIQSWSLTSLQQRLFKTGGRLIRHARYFTLQLAESYLTGSLFRQILQRIERLAWHPT
jgi:hypothetical protein